MGLMAGPESPAVTLAMRGLRVGVDGHGDESIDQRDGVGARFLRDAGHLCNAGHVGRKLDDQRPERDAFGASHHFLEGVRIAAELQSAFGCVGAGNVQFVGGNAFAVVENLDGSFVVIAGIAEHVGQHNDILHPLEFGQLLSEKCRGSDVLQADGVEHARSGFPQARRRIANHWLPGKAFDDESTQLGEVNYILELDPIAKGPAGCNDGVFE
jgi:hypothetical protein